MRARDREAVTREAIALMRLGASQAAQSTATLQKARRLLRSHPDYARRKRAEARGADARAETFVSWLEGSVASVLADVNVSEVERILLHDLRRGRRGWRADVAYQRRDAAWLARQRAKRESGQLRMTKQEQVTMVKLARSATHAAMKLSEALPW